MTQPPPHSAEAHATPPGETPRVRLRAILLGLALALAICLVTPFNNAFRQATPLGGGHFPLAPFFIFFWLSLLVSLVGRLRRGRPWLSGRELLVVWILMVLVSGIAYTGLVRTFFINLTAPLHFASVENRWPDILQPLLPQGMFPRDSAAVEALYDGLPGGRQLGWLEVLAAIPWKAWVGPLLHWAAFVLLCYAVMVCLANLFSRQWQRNERMNFPLLRVPLLMEEALDRGEMGAFLGNRFLLAGLALPLLLHLINGLGFYFPGVPQIPTLILAGPYFSPVGLFSGFHKLKIHIYPAFIGFAFLTSRQISFSFWFFFIGGSLLLGLLSILGYDIPAAALGVTFGPTLSRLEEMQMVGAYGAFCLFILWLARHHLVYVLRAAFRHPGEPAAPEEWFSIRTAFWGLILGSAVLVFWLQRLGLATGMALALVGACYMILLVASRIIAQGGLAYFTLTIAPLDGLITVFGPKAFSAAGILVAGVVQKALFLDLRESLLPSLVHAGSVTQRVGSRRLVFGAIGVTLVAGVAASLLAMLALSYKYGIRELGLDWATSTTLNTYENMVRIIEAPPALSPWVRGFAVAGAAVMLLLVAGYHRFYWWPLHPLGYLTAYSSAMRILWFSFFVGWACNALCMRYGGVLLFKKLRFFFIGLIVGDFLMGGAWALWGLFADASYLVLPD